MNLPVLNCDGCSACCMEMGSPPGYAAIVIGGSECWPEHTGDVDRLAAAPDEAKEVIIEYVLSGMEDDCAPCCWLDVENNRCRWYEHRPSICRQLEPGSDACLGWRKEYSK